LVTPARNAAAFFVSDARRLRSLYPHPGVPKSIEVRAKDCSIEVNSLSTLSFTGKCLGWTVAPTEYAPTARLWRKITTAY
jgi:aspartate/methionine/tyrosine aminotransferase